MGTKSTGNDVEKYSSESEKHSYCQCCTPGGSSSCLCTLLLHTQFPRRISLQTYAGCCCSVRTRPSSHTECDADTKIVFRELQAVRQSVNQRHFSMEVGSAYENANFAGALGLHGVGTINADGTIFLDDCAADLCV